MHDRLDALLIWDDDHRITHCVSATDAVLGYTPEALVGQPLDLLLPGLPAHPLEAAEPAKRGTRFRDTRQMRELGPAAYVEATRRDGSAQQTVLAVTPLQLAGKAGYAALIRDANSQADIDRLKAHRDELVAQARINQVVQRATDVPSLLDGVLNELIAMPEMILEHKAGVFVVDDVPQRPLRRGQLPVLQPRRALRLMHTVGAFSDEFMEAEAWVPFGSCLCGRAAEGGEVIISANCFHDARHDHTFTGMKAHGHYIVPMKSGDEVYGVIFLYTAPDPDASEERRLLLETVGSQVGLGMQRLRAEEKLRRLAMEDPLTGVLNRRAVLEALAAASQHAGDEVAVIMLDIDHFKAVNDTHGHPAGDAVICATSARMTEVLRPGDALGRFGGEEFLAVLPKTSLAEALAVAEQLRRAVAAEPVVADGETIAVTASLGVACTDEDHPNADEANGSRQSDAALIARADGALYAAKEAGRDCVRPKLTA